ncbi:lipoyl(octanoyl) transferase LipB [Microcoleus sp. ARI1-B5]|uniref:lipoyl(octanoyl) transferase LipB n=1 Tax=unclassified Microcoleus TaxID=2642155 RepID=UPI002FD6DCC3
MISPLIHKPVIPEPCLLLDWGLVPYSQAWEIQQKLVQERRDNPDLPDVLILLEHPPVYTLGLGSKLDFVKFDPGQTGPQLHRVERGGEVTYHCPGQLVGYPILNLRRHQQDLHWYLRQLEEVLLGVLFVCGLKGSRVPGMTGVWVDGCKVGAIGIKVSRWITMHGFALNVCPDLAGFGQIVPCGIADKPVGSLEQFIPGIEVDRVRSIVVAEFARVFGVEIVRSDREIVPSDRTYG